VSATVDRFARHAQLYGVEFVFEAATENGFTAEELRRLARRLAHLDPKWRMRTIPENWSDGRSGSAKAHSRAEKCHAKGVTGTRTHNSYRNMLERCRDPNHIGWEHYGGRGITVCDRWNPKAGSFENFLADMGERPEGKTLDRINVDGNYEPSNCRWATPAEQAGNRRKRKKPRPARQGAICGACGDLFPAARSTARYCSAACRQRAHRRGLS
jgi:hypothetical protein